MRRDGRYDGSRVAGHPWDPRRVRADARGFSLMEVLIALSIFVIVLLAVYSSFESSRATYAAGEQRADIQQNARIAMELLSADLRLAGYGFPTGGGAITAATATSITFWADLVNASTIIMADVNPGNTVLSVENASGIQAGDTVYLINGGTSEQRTVQAVNTAVNPDTITLTAAVANTYPWGSQVGLPRLIQYSWAGGTVSKDDGMGGGLQPLANNVQLPPLPTTMFQYFDANNNVTATPANIRRITVTLAAQSPPGAWRQQAFTVASDIRPRNL